MRGHKADRCWQKGKGKGGKGDWKEGKGGSKGKGWSKRKWSNPGHTLDNSWYQSNWHRKAYGLQVDPWSAVEPVPHLCAVSLYSSCEDFSEPKRMSRGTPIKKLQSGSSRNFAHVNKISNLASDDDESPGQRCASKHTSTIQCQQRRYGDERGDETKISQSPKTGTSELNAQQVSYLAASGGDSWIWLEKIQRDHGLGIC